MYYLSWLLTFKNSTTVELLVLVQGLMSLRIQLLAGAEDMFPTNDLWQEISLPWLVNLSIELQWHSAMALPRDSQKIQIEAMVFYDRI